MNRVMHVWVFAVVLCALPQVARAQVSETSESQATEDASTISYVFPLPSSRLLSDAQLAGKKLFLQTCSTCHLPGLPIYKAYGPILDSKVIAARGVETFRKVTLTGTPRMPGWQYTLQPPEVDAIIAYLNTLTYQSTTKRYIQNSAKRAKK